MHSCGLCLGHPLEGTKACCRDESKKPWNKDRIVDGREFLLELCLKEV